MHPELATRFVFVMLRLISYRRAIQNPHAHALRKIERLKAMPLLSAGFTRPLSHAQHSTLVLKVQGLALSFTLLPLVSSYISSTTNILVVRYSFLRVSQPYGVAMVASVFPHFSDGNVEIRLTQGGQPLVLHAHVLSLHSPWFKACLSETWKAAEQTNGANDGFYWIFLLKFEKGSSLGMLTRMEASAEGEMHSDHTIRLSSQRSLHCERVQSVQAHEAMLGLFYHIGPGFHPHQATGESYGDVMELHRVSTVYGCEALAAVHIKNWLLTWQNDIDQYCNKDPLSVLQLAMELKCEKRFKQAAAVILGQERGKYIGCCDKLSELGVLSVFEAKRSQMMKKLLEIDYALLLLAAPRPLYLSKHSIAPMVYREWLSKELNGGKGAFLDPNYAKLYLDIANPDLGNPKSSVRIAVLALVPRQIGVDNVLEGLQKMFKRAEEIVAPCLEDASGPNKSAVSQGTLRFMTIDGDDLPWAKK